MQTPQIGSIPFATRVRVVPASFRDRLDGAALAQLDTLILAIGSFRSLPAEQRARRRRKGIVALFCGLRSTGKTTAAQVLARDTGHDLHIVDLGRLISRDRIETERNLDLLLSAAQAADAALLFDEGGALFGRGADSSNSGVGVNQVLQRLDSHAGITIFAAEQRDSLDPVIASWCDFVLDFRPEAATAGKGRRFRCPACGFRVFNRRVRSCERCRAPLPEEFAYSGAELERIERDHRENLESLRRSQGTSASGGGPSIDLDLDLGLDLGFGDGD